MYDPCIVILLVFRVPVAMSVSLRPYIWTNTAWNVHCHNSPKSLRGVLLSQASCATVVLFGAHPILHSLAIHIIGRIARYILVHFSNQKVEQKSTH